ncbi:hypothetical protein [Stenotrophomonas sp. TWI377]|uniref:hypothetical protein n=1 Tax=Stenotrophomonas sp. TWI377 TaxID=3136775 RepID=UPI00320B9A77
MSVLTVGYFLQSGAVADGLAGGLLPLILFGGVAGILLGTFALGRIIDAVELVVKRTRVAVATRGVGSSELVLLKKVESEYVHIVYQFCGLAVSDMRPRQKSELLTVENLISYAVVHAVIDDSLSVTTSLIDNISRAKSRGAERVGAFAPDERRISVAAWSV